MTFCLNSTIIKPENNKPIKNAIVLLHGYGGDGKDISILSVSWKRHLPNTIFFCKTLYNINMISGILVKILSIVLLIAVGIVLILGIGTLFKGGDTSKKYSNKLMQLRVLLQFIAILVLVGFAYFFKN